MLVFTERLHSTQTDRYKVGVSIPIPRKITQDEGKIPKNCSRRVAITEVAGLHQVTAIVD